MTLFYMFYNIAGLLLPLSCFLSLEQLWKERAVVPEQRNLSVRFYRQEI